jgi:SAM-dependent methyltransferase
MEKYNIKIEEEKRKVTYEMLSLKVDKLLENNKKVKLLEAGCGSAMHLKIKKDIYAVGIDISQKQLNLNNYLNEKILGDIQIYPLPKGEYDIIICWEVLEHLSTPIKALKNMFNALNEGGVCVLAFPNVLSLKGMITKFSPHLVHQLFYRLMRYQFKPFPTYLRWSIRMENIKKFARKEGLSIAHSTNGEGFVQKRLRSKLFLIDLLFGFVDLNLKLITLGKYNSFLRDNNILILQKCHKTVSYGGN